MNAKISVFLVCVETIMYPFLYNLHDCTFKHVLFFPKIYRKIPLTRPGRIYGQNSHLKFDGPIFRWGRGRAYIREEKNFNLQSVKLIFLSFFQYKARISTFFMSGNMWNMFKVNNKDSRIRDVKDKVKNKDTVDVVLASL